jgi:large subunit ribosomal protein L17
MRHRVHGRKLGRTSAHRKALFRNQLTALFTHERIVTTVAKAKELRPIAERMVTIARTGTLAARRKVATMVADKEIAKRLFDEIAPRFADRPGGYTRIMRLGRRHGDNAELAIIEFIDYELSDHQDGGGKEDKGSFLDRAKGVFGGGAAADAATAADDEGVKAETGTDEPSEEAAADTPTETEEPVEAKAEADEVADEPVEAEPVEVDEPVKETEAASVDETPAVEASTDDGGQVEDEEKKSP